MSAADVDAYIEALDEPVRSTMQEMRRRILEVVPDAEQRISYRLPAFAVEGTVIAGLGAFKGHLSYLPHSGSTLPAVGDVLSGYTCTKSALHFAADAPLPRALVRQLVTARLHEAGGRPPAALSPRIRTAVD